MIRIPTTTYLPLIGLLLAPLAMGQNTPGDRNQDLRLDAVRVPIHTAAPDLGVAYGIWAAGDGYKASFYDGMTFVPYLGADYPHNQPLSWCTESVRVGEVELMDAASPAHGVQVSDWRYEYRHGSLTEAYDVRVDGLEQTFVITQLPAAGDLVLTGRVTTAMVTDDVAPGHGALLFRDEHGHELVRYGEAFAFDARGERIALSTGFTNGRVTLHVPGDWLRSAQLPVTIDPLLSRAQVSGWGAPTFGGVRDIDISSANGNAVVFTRSASSNDDDCYGLKTTGDFSSAPAVWADLTSSWSSDHVTCAWSHVSGHWVFAWRRFFGGLSPTVSAVRLHLHQWGSTTFGTAYQAVTSYSGRNEWRPDIGASPYGNTIGGMSSDRFMIVFQFELNGTADFANTQDSGIGTCWLQVPQGATSATILHDDEIRDSPSFDHERPCVRQEGANDQWEMAWQRYNNLNLFGDWDIEVSIYGADASQPALPFERVHQLLPNQTAGAHQTGPVIAGASFGAIAYSETPAGLTGKTSLIAGEKLIVQTFEFDESAPPGTPISWRGHEIVRQSTSRIWEATGLAWHITNYSHFALGFRAVSPGVPTAYFARLSPNADLLEGGTGGGAVLYYVNGHTPSMIAATHDHIGGNFRFAYGVGGVTGVPVYGHELEPPAAPPVLNSGYGCDGNWALSWDGPQLVGSMFGKVKVTAQTPQTTLHAVLLSTSVLDIGILDPVVAPGCRLLVDTFGPGYLGMLPPKTAYSVQYFTLPLPGYLPSMDLYFQDVVFDGTLFRSTHRMTLPIVR